MDTKTASIGVVAVVAIAALVKPAPVTLVSASQSESDKAVAEIGKLSPELSDRTCVRQWVEVRPNPPALAWLCDGAYLPAQQAWLDATAGADGVEVKFSPEDDGKGGVKFHARVLRGELPAEPPPSPVEPEKAKKDKP